jgi:hypothetical protein
MPLQSDSRISGRGRILLALVLGVVVLSPFGYSVVSRVAGSPDQPEPFLERPDSQYDSCVRETEYMRYHHWELLSEVREDVVRYGHRNDEGLKDCRKCHTSREHFCDRCHEAASVWPDCFGCHYYP